ncbi:glycosyltransferase family 4 protein [Streptomyces sp. GC420]|uniref:glycosyltransferase family 4 protein n=1 Tax=Streptomyces sp. GC420 TaxID=2697568 RepID=UPI001414EB7F|nr:glycosyltransferase family 4 protein [Streptomyces sp. GC420]NBM14467.1 glycosyltransferase [Streptomyces sp. GC420]
MRWQFHYPKRTSFYPADYENPGLGGCEASLVLLTRALAARGHHVEVFNCCYRPGTYDGVTWRMAWELDSAPAPDVAVAVRFDEALWPAGSKAGHHLFWMLDDRTRGPAAFADTFRDRGGRVVLASQAMRQRLDIAAVDIPVHLIPLPVETSRYNQPIADRAPICLFSSMPNRGLDAALALWPRIRAAVPDAELWVTSGWQLWGFTNAESDDRWHQLLGGRPLPEGVRLLGARPRAELIETQQQAALTLYPCRFPEMFCLSAAESAAAGTPVITSPMDALTERVHHNHTGILIDGDINRPETQNAFADAAIELLTNPARRTALGHAGRSSSNHLAPDHIAAAWEDLLGA